ncbi:hypothetical protein C8R46DRAFT_569532 [Mycena filopes]|nr:hypothetical protein C8R46DRAFT_569532 [Mycena filopes]
MSSSRATTPDDPLSDIFGAMDQDSPVAAARLDKRPLAEDSDDDDAAPSTAPSGPAAQGPSGQNAVVGARRYGEHKRLKTTQVDAVETFLNDIPSVREAKLFVHLMVLENSLDKIVTATAPYAVSGDSKKNLQNYAAAVLLSSKTRTYKGSTATNTVLDLVKIHRGDLPAGIEFNPADWAKVGAVAEDALTQRRSKFKKLIIYSLKPHDTKSAENAAPADQLNIFQLAEAFVDGTRCSVNVPLCARIALMRKTYLKSPGIKFWDDVDVTLSKIRKRADGDKKKIAKAFRHILDNDQAIHGSADYRHEEETVDLFQQQVDDVIDANVAETASTAAT